MFHHTCQTLFSSSIKCNIWENREVSIRRSHPRASQKKMYAYLTLIYGLECYTLLKVDIRSLDFVVTRFLMKLFKSINNDTINDCRIYFNFLMPSELLENRRNRFEGKFIDCCNLLYYFGINKIM